MVEIKAIVGSLLGIIITFYALSSLFPTLETASGDLNAGLAASSLSGVSSLAGLPGVAVLVVVIVFIFGIILGITRLIEE